MIMRRQFKFYASHRNQHLQDKCACLHGHRYNVDYDLSVGRTRQHGHHVSTLFHELDAIHEPIRSILDHSCMLDIADPLLPMMKQFVDTDPSGKFWKLAMFAMPTSAENLAFLIYNAMNQVIMRDGHFQQVSLINIYLRETDSTVIEYNHMDLASDVRRFGADLSAAGFLFKLYSKDETNASEPTAAPEV